MKISNFINPELLNDVNRTVSATKKAIAQGPDGLTPDYAKKNKGKNGKDDSDNDELPADAANQLRAMQEQMVEMAKVIQLFAKILGQMDEGWTDNLDLKSKERSLLEKFRQFSQRG